MRITYTGSRAEQLISGAMRMVASRSRRFSMTRVAMMPGTAQANDDKQRNKRLAAQPHAGHQPVHQERGPGHVAAVLQERDEEKQNQYLRQEDHDGADAANHAVDHQ